MSRAPSIQVKTVEDIDNARKDLEAIIAEMSWVLNRLSEKFAGVQLPQDLNVFINVLYKNRDYMELLKSNLANYTDIHAFVARNCIELNIIAQGLMSDPANIERFLGEFAYERQDVAKSYLLLTQPGDTRRSHFEKHITEIKDVADKHDLDAKRAQRIFDLAKTYGMETEYNSYYKLLSKLTHPTSYSINMKPEDIYGADYSEMFINIARAFALKTFANISQHISAHLK